ncbi:MAG: hypothetical protein RR131_02250 [Anaerovorax sp.]
MSNFPDVLGMELDVAKTLLEAGGFAFRVVETKPDRPPRTEYDCSKMRIIKVKEQEDIAIVTVCKI